MAIGASRADVLRMTVGLGVRWMALGLLTGFLASLAVTRVLASQLFDVSPVDPLTLISAAAVVAVAAFSASYFPALRATRVDPMVVLRYE